MIALFILMVLLPHPHDDPQPSRQYKVKPNGEFNLLDDTMLRDKLLTRGKYLIEHHVDGAVHSVTVAQVPDRKRIPRPAVTVAATMVPVKKAFSRSIVHAEPPDEGNIGDRYYRIMKIDVAGEDVEHLF